MNNLFSEFQPNTAQEWKNQVIKDLKGESFDSLIWQNDNEIEIQPFYTSEDLKYEYRPAFYHNDWEICVKNSSRNAASVNKKFLKQLNSGASAIALNCQSIDITRALKGVQLEFIQSSFRVNTQNAFVLKNYLDTHYSDADVSSTLIPESITNQNELEAWKEVVVAFKNYQNIRTITIDILKYHNLNCFAYYEVALLFSQLTEFLENFVSAGILPLSPIAIRTGVHSDYFVQMAKLRAIRRLWYVLRDAYGIKNELYLIVETSLTNKTVSDSYNNLLRTTVEAMAAVSGGCNELVVNEFDVLFPKTGELSERMAINQQLILKDEVYLNKMSDTACGSYYLEHLTDSIANKALETFKRFESEGGYFKCLVNLLFEKEIRLQARKKEEYVQSKKQIVIGVNKFKNESEKLSMSRNDLKYLLQLKFNNPALNFEYEHYFDLKHA